MPFPPCKASAEKHLFFAIIGWIVFVVWFLVSNLDLEPHTPALWSVEAVAALLALYTAIVVPIYLYQMWRRLPIVPNKASYGLWMGFESLAFLAILTMFWFACIHSGWLAQVCIEGVRFDSR
ncbi:MAG: hypothetical protein WAO35_07455 [Terriglobia bacterium]